MFYRLFINPSLYRLIFTISLIKFIITSFALIVNTVKYVPVAQLDRVSDSDSEGRRFESCRAYQKGLPERVGFFGICKVLICDLQARSALRRQSRRMLPQGDQGEALCQVAGSNPVGHTKKAYPQGWAFLVSVKC